MMEYGPFDCKRATVMVIKSKKGGDFGCKRGAYGHQKDKKNIEAKCLIKTFNT